MEEIQAYPNALSLTALTTNPYLPQKKKKSRTYENISLFSRTQCTLHYVYLFHLMGLHQYTRDVYTHIYTSLNTLIITPQIL